jgi:hypothetical protein
MFLYIYIKVRLVKKGNVIMGLSASQARLLMLTARKSDIEFSVQIINQRRTALAVQSEQLIRQYIAAMYQNDDPTVLNQTTLGDPSTTQPVGALPGFIFTDPTAPANVGPVHQTPIATGDYEIKMAQVQALDKELELREKNLETQHKAIETEYDAVKKVIDKNIEISFKTFG